MNITQYTKKDGTTAWRFFIYLGTDETTGKPRRTNRQGFKTKKEAELEYMRLKTASESEALGKDNITFKQVYHEWLEQYKNTVKESTLNNTKDYFRVHILPALGAKRIAKIRQSDCQRLVNTLFKKELSGYKTIFYYVGRVFKYARSVGYIRSMPHEFVTIPIKQEEAGEKPLPQFFTTEELKVFFAELERSEPYKYFALFRVLAFTGMRRGEALALTWEDIDFQKDTISVNKTLAKGLNNKTIVQAPKTSTGRRVVSVDAETLRILRRWKSLQAFEQRALRRDAPPQLLFPGIDGGFMASVTPGAVITRICKKTGLKRITTHGLRHTHCSILFEAGASLKEVQDRLGHSDIHTTMNIYAHVSEKRKDETAEKFAAYVGF